MSGLSGHVFKLLYIILSKGVPLLTEMVLKDKNLMEFLSMNKTLITMLFIVIILSFTLLVVRHELHVLKTSIPVLQREHTLPKPAKFPSVSTNDPPTPPDQPKTKDQATILQRDASRDLIKRRLEEIQ